MWPSTQQTFLVCVPSMIVSSENVTPPETGEKGEEIYRATFCARPGKFTTADSFEIPAD